MAKGKFTLADFLQQMKQMKKMGPLKQIMKLMPGMGANAGLLDELKGDEIGRMEAIVHSMTPEERDKPEIIDARRRRRIAAGSGTEVQDVSGLVKSFTQAADMMKQMAGMGMRERMSFAQNMAGGMAGGAMPGKTKQRSRRLSSKERKRRQKKRRKR
jgi:signal recognition particle subunit SRP54